MAILDLISHVHFPSFVNMLPKYSTFSGCFWSIIIVTRDGCLEILITFVFLKTNGGVVYLQIILSPEEAFRIYDISVFGKRLSRKKDNVVVLPFAFHIAVQQSFKLLWSRLLLYELEPSRASFVLCFKPLLTTLLLETVLVSLFI